jgi:hypothetical protein
MKYSRTINGIRTVVPEYVKLIFFAFVATYAVSKKRVNVVSGFRREVNENCALLGNYAACSGNSLPSFRDNLSVLLWILALEERTDKFSRNNLKKRCVKSQKSEVSNE